MYPPSAVGVVGQVRHQCPRRLGQDQVELTAFDDADGFSQKGGNGGVLDDKPFMVFSVSPFGFRPKGSEEYAATSLVDYSLGDTLALHWKIPMKNNNTVRRR